MITFRLKEILKNKNMTITDLHEITGISQNTLSLIANGKSKGIQLETIDKILDATGASLNDLMERTSNMYCLSVEGIDNNYSVLKDNETRTFRYQVINTTDWGEKEMVYDFDFSVLYFKLKNKIERSYLHLSFSRVSIPKEGDQNLALLLNQNGNKSGINAISFLVVSDLLWHIDIPKNDIPFLAYFNWLGFERDNVYKTDINVPISTLKLHLKRDIPDPNKYVANFNYLEDSISNITRYSYNNETGEAYLYIQFI